MGPIHSWGAAAFTATFLASKCFQFLPMPLFILRQMAGRNWVAENGTKLCGWRIRTAIFHEEQWLSNEADFVESTRLSFDKERGKNWADDIGRAQKATPTSTQTN
jgi:hypothetical protein